MNIAHQVIHSPDGAEMVVITRADYDRLVSLAEDAKDIADANPVVVRHLSERFTVPGDVVEAIFAGATPVEAWRRHRGMSQAELATATGLTQPAIARLEKRIAVGQTHSFGRVETRRALMRAFGIPPREEWALDPAAEAGGE